MTSKSILVALLATMLGAGANGEASSLRITEARFSSRGEVEIKLSHDCTEYGFGVVTGWCPGGHEQPLKIRVNARRMNGTTPIGRCQVWVETDGASACMHPGSSPGRKVEVQLLVDGVHTSTKLLKVKGALWPWPDDR